MPVLPVDADVFLELELGRAKEGGAKVSLTESAEGRLRAAMADSLGRGTVPVDPDSELWRRAASPKAPHRMSLVDAFAAATALESQGRLVTGADEAFDEVPGLEIRRVLAHGALDPSNSDGGIAEKGSPKRPQRVHDAYPEAP